jgi:diguanylate cyclase (GGDEF)-like protein
MATGDQGREREAVLAVGLVDLPERVSSRFQVLAALDGMAGLEAAASRKPLLVVVSANLRAPSALEVLERLEAEPATRSIPVVLAGEGALVSDLEVPALSLGAFDVLRADSPTPVAEARLLRAIRAGRERLALCDAAQTDGLTGLANFRGLTARLQAEFRRAVRYEYPLTAVMLDLDHLKELNDLEGHEQGNRALVALARHLRGSLRTTDFAARYGGDEFVALLPHQTPREAEVFARRLTARLSEVPFKIEPSRRSQILGVSVGIAGHTAASPRSGPEALLRAADGALYEAKRRGRGQIVIVDAARDSESPDLS